MSLILVLIGGILTGAGWFALPPVSRPKGDERPLQFAVSMLAIGTGLGVLLLAFVSASP